MAINIIFAILIIFVIIRTTAYGIYCIKKTSITGGISVFFLDACVIAAGYIALFTERGI